MDASSLSDFLLHDVRDSWNLLVYLQQLKFLSWQMNRTSRIDEFPIYLCTYWQKDKQLSSRKNASNTYWVFGGSLFGLIWVRVLCLFFLHEHFPPKTQKLYGISKEIKIGEYLLCRFHVCWSSWCCWSDRWIPPFRPTVPEKRPTPQVSWEAEGTWGSHGYQLPWRNS